MSFVCIRMCKQLIYETYTTKTASCHYQLNKISTVFFLFLVTKNSIKNNNFVLSYTIFSGIQDAYYSNR